MILSALITCKPSPLIVISIVLIRFAMACVFNWFLSARPAASRTIVSSVVLPEGPSLAVDSKNGTAPWSDNRRNKLAKQGPSSSDRSSPTPLSTTGGGGGSASFITAAQMGTELYSVCLATCYSEGEGSLWATLDSISATTYADERELLFVVADGMVTGTGGKMSTPDICVSLLETDPRFGNPMPMAYEAIEAAAKKANRVMVYAGHCSKWLAHV
jgi:chitin synthase